MTPSSNPLDALEQNGYDVTDFVYPIDLMNDPGEQHMVVFYINESKNTQFQTVNPNNTPLITSPGSVITQPAVNNSDNITTFNKRPITRTSTVIALYMPPLIQSTYSPVWDSIETNASGGVMQSLLGQNSSIRRALGEVGIGIAANLAEDSKDFLSTLGVDAPVAEGVSLVTRAARNPHLEMLFRTIGFREYTFEFQFTPRSEQEAQTVFNIIKAFKFYAAPEIMQGDNVPRYYIYPAEFDIQFWSNGKENSFINKISTCACVGVSVNYTGSGGWSALRTGAQNGVPVETHLTLQFKETEIITKNRVQSGF